MLIVEDEQRMRDLLLRSLTNWGFEATAARSAEEAMRTTESAPPDIVLLDLNLPGMDGMQFFQTLRQKRPQVQGIVLTGFASIEAAKQAIHMDMVEFLTKPCHLGEVEQALDRAMRRIAPPEPPIVPDPSLAGLNDDGEAGEASAGAPNKTLEEVERQHILSTLSRNGGNRTATAAELGISRRTLYYKLTEYQKQGFEVE
ncbi:MAG TPA: response regulator [Tepidisphaeraceae bacterium]|nr:response regulator [Tepidisphaeraceae bacterium]